MPAFLTSRRPTAPAAAAASSPHVSSPGAALAVALLGFFVITLDALVVNVALPVIGQELGGGMTGLQWVLDSYTLMFAALLLFGGTLSDRIGARQGFAAGLLVFVAASAACALAPSLGWLVAARFLQGAGAALMMPASLALIREAFPDPARRARAIAVWSVGGAVASAAGPVLGGFLALSSWRSIFFINLPVGLVALFLLSRIPRSPRQTVPFDWTGQAAAVLGMGALTYGVIEGGAAGFDAPHVLASLGIATAALLAFLLSQARGSHAMLPLDMFRSRPVAVSMSVGFAFTVAFYGLVFLLSLYLQQNRGLSALETGLAFLPMTALVAFTNLLSARIAARYGPKVPIAVGQALMAAGLLAIALAAAEAPTPLLAVLMIPVGLGGSLSIPPMTALLLDSVPAQLAGATSGGLNTCRQLGGAWPSRFSEPSSPTTASRTVSASACWPPSGCWS
ncbi:MFS transporter [Arthrobacter cavernae]|uniref:MFS transporter n=1 Tax=Arthrobacter cavernae TaxID=2817681 RepID=A0A939HHM0_9MICC|nr:MFS transporter [Arthrobacter cavernae]MBO1268630.1 MFS transporter [Arthrobacter cavernae]